MLTKEQAEAAAEALLLKQRADQVALVTKNTERREAASKQSGVGPVFLGFLFGWFMKK